MEEHNSVIANQRVFVGVFAGREKCEVISGFIISFENGWVYLTCATDIRNFVVYYDVQCQEYCSICQHRIE